jgi:hypothetical protein
MNRLDLLIYLLSPYSLKLNGQDSVYRPLDNTHARAQAPTPDLGSHGSIPG